MSDKTTTRKAKFTIRIPPARIKKIIQTDEEIGKMANAVPVMIGRSLELFVAQLLTRAVDIAHDRNAKTLTPQLLKEAVKSDLHFRFLDSVVSATPDSTSTESAESSVGCHKRRGSRTTSLEERKTKKSRKNAKMSTSSSIGVQQSEEDDLLDEDYEDD